MHLAVAIGAVDQSHGPRQLADERSDDQCRHTADGGDGDEQPVVHKNAAVLLEERRQPFDWYGCFILEQEFKLTKVRR